MASLNFNEIFGSQSWSDIDETSEKYNIVIDLKSFQNVEDGGDIQNSLGLTNLASEAVFYTDNADAGGGSAKFVNLIYAIMLLIMQNQAASKNEDPEQKIYIQPSGVSVVTSGNRQGQVERRFTVSIFSDAGVNNVADIDEI